MSPAQCCNCHVVIATAPSLRVTSYRERCCSPLTWGLRSVLLICSGQTKKPDPKAMVNQDIFTIPLRARLKFSASLQLVFSSNIVWVVTPRSPQNGAGGEENLQREQLTARSLGSQPKGAEGFSGDASCCPHPTDPTSTSPGEAAATFSPSSNAPFEPAAPDTNFINSHFLPVPKHPRSQRPARQRDPSEATRISEAAMRKQLSQTPLDSTSQEETRAKCNYFSCSLGVSFFKSSWPKFTVTLVRPTSDGKQLLRK